jgi:cytochrome c biogenesis protein CcmG/thiol:disulfide interchange protein DsbE
MAAAVMRVGGPPAPGDEAPSFTAPRLEGEGSVALADFEGTPVVLNFWASWCGPCKDEAPMLRRAAETFDGQVEIVGINIKDSRTDAIAFAEAEGLDYEHVRDEGGDIERDYGLTGQPETFFIDADGEIVEHVNGRRPGDAWPLTRRHRLPSRRE